MSFYGNSYYYTVESFARIVLQNSGLNKRLTPNTAEMVKSAIIDASKREAGVVFDTANHWISLEPIVTHDDINDVDIIEGFQLWHNTPLISDATNLIATLSKEDLKEVPASVEKIVENVTFDDYLKVPVISYDSTGHIVPTEQVRYVKMPSNPTADVLDRMNEIDGKNIPEGETDNSLKAQLESKMETIETRMSKIDGKNIAGETVEPLGGSLSKKLTDRMSTIENNQKQLSEDVGTAVSGLQDQIDLITELNVLVKTGNETEGITSILSRLALLESTVATLLETNK